MWCSPFSTHLYFDLEIAAFFCWCILFYLPGVYCLKFCFEIRFWIGHFRITTGLVFKASLGAHPFICKSIFIHTQINPIFMWMKINLQMKRWAPRLALKTRPEVIRKWPIRLRPCQCQGNESHYQMNSCSTSSWRVISIFLQSVEFAKL